MRGLRCAQSVAFGALRRAAVTFAATQRAGEETLGARKAERKIGGEAVGGVVSKMRFGSA